MSEFYERNKTGMTPSSFKTGDFKMVKVKKGRRGPNSRSLVFRISRNSYKSISDDSGIKCSPGTAEEYSTSEEEKNTFSSCPLKVKIPKSACYYENVNNKTFTAKSESPENISLGNSVDNTKKIYDVFSDERNFPDTVKDDLNHNNGAFNSKDDAFDCNQNIYSISSGIKNINLKQSPGIIEAKSNFLRRSSRRVLVRLQKKDSELDFPFEEEEPFNAGDKLPITSSSDYEYVPHVEKRKRGRKPAVRGKKHGRNRGFLHQDMLTSHFGNSDLAFNAGADCKKRKYGKRGRPPKSSVPKPLSQEKPTYTAGYQNEKMVLVAPPKNSVWTLIPKELFESDFFKSQLLKVQASNTTEKGAPNVVVSTPITLSSPSIQISTPKIYEKLQFRTPRVTATHPPVARRTMPESKACKRPTVIYFKTEKKKFDCCQDQQAENRNTQTVLNNEFTSTQNDLLYLFEKYRMLGEVILKKYYETAGGNLSEAENLLSGILLNSSTAPSEITRICNSQASLPPFSSIFGLNSSERNRHQKVPSDTPSLEPNFEEIDTLSRRIILQSLQILNCEEAVLM